MTVTNILNYALFRVSNWSYLAVLVLKITTVHRDIPILSNEILIKAQHLFLTLFNAEQQKVEAYLFRLIFLFGLEIEENKLELNFCGFRYRPLKRFEIKNVAVG